MFLPQKELLEKEKEYYMGRFIIALLPSKT